MASCNSNGGESFLTICFFLCPIVVVEMSLGSVYFWYGNLNTAPMSYLAINPSI